MHTNIFHIYNGFPYMQKSRTMFCCLGHVNVSVNLWVGYIQCLVCSCKFFCSCIPVCTLCTCVGALSSCILIYGIQGSRSIQPLPTSVTLKSNTPSPSFACLESSLVIRGITSQQIFNHAGGGSRKHGAKSLNCWPVWTTNFFHLGKTVWAFSDPNV